MAERSRLPSRRRGKAKGKRRLSVFAPGEPQIVGGWFKGRKLSDLTDGELSDFIVRDARLQTREVTFYVSFFPLKTLRSQVADLSQYWFAKYELERRKPKANREDIGLEIALTDSPETIARKMADYGYRAAAQKYHPDHAGSNTIMQRVNEARELVRQLLRK